MALLWTLLNYHDRVTQQALVATVDLVLQCSMFVCCLLVRAIHVFDNEPRRLLSLLIQRVVNIIKRFG